MVEEQAFDKTNGKTLHHDLDFLAGSWSREEMEAFDKILAEQRTIDPELWESQSERYPPED